MPRGLQRFHHSGHLHFVTFSCYHRKPLLAVPQPMNRFVAALEEARQNFGWRIFGYVVMPEHVHLLVDEPERGSLADVIHSLKLSLSKQKSNRKALTSDGDRLWQTRYYDRNIFTSTEFMEKIRYIHRNPVKRGLCEKPEDWLWSSFRHYALKEPGVVEIASEWTLKVREDGSKQNL